MVVPDTIPGTSEPAAERSERRVWLPRWIGVVFPLAILGGVGLVLLYRENRIWLDITVAIAGAAGLGLVVGLAARRSLPRRSSLVRWLVAMGALTVGLLVAGLLSGGAMGLGPLLPGAPAVRWGELLQLIVAGLAAWLAVRAYSRPSLPLEGAAAPDGETNWGFTYHPTIHDTQPIRARRGRSRPPAEPARRPSTALRTGPSTASALAAAGAVRTSAVRPVSPLRRSYERLVARLERAVAWRPTLGLLPSQRKSSPIRFTGAAEDRCPYCLDIVEEHDRRGVTVCPVCHTRHHAECWAVTGTCQMPHLYAESGRASSRSIAHGQSATNTNRSGAAR